MLRTALIGPRDYDDAENVGEAATDGELFDIDDSYDEDTGDNSLLPILDSYECFETYPYE